ncbi:MAG: DcrB-related protein [Byssovorax sp.]
MSTYHANEFTLDLPEGMHDKSVQIFALANQGPSDLSIVVAREKPNQGEAMPAFANRTLTALSEQLPVLTVLSKEAVQLDGQPAIRTDYTWSSSQGKMFQRQVVTHAVAHDQMLIVTATCRDAMSPEAEAVFAAFLAKFRFRDAEG